MRSESQTDLHLDAHLSTQLLNLCVDDGECLLHELDACRLVRRVGRDDVERGRDEPDLYRDSLGRDGLSCLECGLDGVDPFVREALNLDVGPDLDSLGRQTTGNVLLQGRHKVGSDVDTLVHLLRLAEREARQERKHKEESGQS